MLKSGERKTERGREGTRACAVKVLYKDSVRQPYLKKEKLWRDDTKFLIQ